MKRCTGGGAPRSIFDRTICTAWGAAKFIAFSVFMLTLAGAAFATWFEQTYAEELHAILQHRQPVIRILDRKGELIARHSLRQPQVSFNELPASLIDAVTATEDRRFFQHRGVDPVGLARAVWRNVTLGRLREGGSTLTQQLAKNIYLDRKRTLSRKFRELVIALWLEHHYSKQQILEFYLNKVYFGAGASHGVEAAARFYFDKPASRLELAEAALIAGLLKAPSYYAPTRNLARAHRRAEVVIDNMLAVGAITSQQAADALNRPAMLRRGTPAKAAAPAYAGYAHDWIMQQLQRRLPQFASDLIVETSLDLDLQQRAQKRVRQAVLAHGESGRLDQAAAVLLDERGGVRVMVGGTSYAESQFNRALQARRQPGSAFKPIVYLAAMENGLLPGSTLLDERVTIDGWTPRNASRHHRGEVTLQQSLAFSINSVAVKLARSLGRDKVVTTARRLGIGSKLTHHPSLPLGASELGLTELAGAYISLMNGGHRARPHIITHIRTSKGEVLFEPPKRGKRIVKPWFVRDMNNMLGAVVDYGTGKRAQLEGHPVAGKTGTSQNYRDAWFVGYSGHLTGGVWFGNDDGMPMNKVSGGKLPAELWRQLMQMAHEGLQPRELPGRHPDRQPDAADILVAPPQPDGSLLLDAKEDAPMVEQIAVLSEELANGNDIVIDKSAPHFTDDLVTSSVK